MEKNNIDDKDKQKIFLKMINEVWRFRKSTDYAFNNLSDVVVKKRVLNNITRFDKHFWGAMSEYGYDIVDFLGMEYEIGLPVSPINLIDFESEDKLIVDVIIEPTIKRKNDIEILQKGTVVLRSENK